MMHQVGGHYANRFLCISVLSVASGPRVECKSALTPRPIPLLFLFYFIYLFFFPFLGGGSGVTLTLCSFVTNSTRGFILSLALCFVLVCFSPFSIAITLTGD